MGSNAGRRVSVRNLTGGLQSVGDDVFSRSQSSKFRSPPTRRSAATAAPAIASVASSHRLSVSGPQLGFITPLSTTTQGYLNLKSYWEFAHDNRPDGWNAWVTFVISPAEQTPSATQRRMITK